MNFRHGAVVSGIIGREGGMSVLNSSEMYMSKSQYKKLGHTIDPDRKCFHARQSMSLKHYIKKIRKPAR